MIDLPVPTIIRSVSGGAWGHADTQMQRLGLPRHVRRAIDKELKRIVGEKPAIQRATIDDLAKYAGEPQLGMFPFPVMSPKGSATAIPLALTDTDQTLSTSTTYTETGKSIGTAAAARVIYVTVAWYDSSFGGASITALTVGGASAARAVRASGAGNFNNAEIWVVAAGTGSSIAANTTANIVISISRDVRMTTAIYRGDGYASTATGTGTGTTSATVTIGANGMALVACCNISNASASLSNVTEDYNFSVSAGGHRGIHASKKSTPGQSLTSTFTSGTPNATLMAAAAF